MLLIGAVSICSVSCESDSVEDSSSLLDSPFEVFEYVTSSGMSFIPDINDDTRRISIYDVSAGSEITDIVYKLKAGVSITPEPASRVGAWRETELFVLSADGVEVSYRATLVDYAQSSVATDAVLYTTSTYGCEIEHHLFDLKQDSGTNLLDSYANAVVLFQDYGLDGVRVPIWGCYDPTSGEYGHEVAGTANYNVYKSTYNRVKNALSAYVAGGGSKSDFVVFLSLKSSDDAAVLPSWCYEGGVVSPTNLIPDMYATVVEDLTRGLKTYVDSSIVVHVIGLDNESSIASASQSSLAWTYYDVVECVKSRFAKAGWSTPRFISYEAAEPATFDTGIYKSILTNAPESVDIYGVHYYHDTDHPSKFNALEADWNASMVLEDYLRADEVSREFWASEPHWLLMSEDNTAKYNDDFMKVSEEAMCCLWAQTDLGMSAFSWWGFTMGTDLRSDLMRIASVPITGSTPIAFIDHDDEGFSSDDTTEDDVTRNYDIDSNNLKTRAFINGNTVTIYLLNVDWYESRATAPSYSDYTIGLNDATLANSTISYEQWVGAESGASDYTSASGMIYTDSDDYFSIDIPARSITCLQFTIN